MQVTLVDGVLCVMLYAPVAEKDLTLVMVTPFFEAFNAIVVIDIILIGALVILMSLYYVLSKLKTRNTDISNLKAEVVTDKLTGLYNRSWLSAIDLEDFCRQSFTVIFFDIDDFKQYNDRYNHSYGDCVIQFVADCLRSCTRPKSDIGIRYAGDEYVILRSDTDVHVAQNIVLRLMERLGRYEPPEAGHEPIKISSGIVSGIKGKDNLDDVLSRADDAAYAAKRAGKNRIVTGG